MKHFVTWLAFTLLALTLIAQTTGSTVTISLTGNRNKQVFIDGNEYVASSYNTSSTASNRSEIVVPGLSTGQHTLEIINENRNTNAEDRITTTFNVRQGYDLMITVRNNGAVQLRETKSKVLTTGHPGYGYSPMSSTSFNTLLQNVRRQTRTSSRYSMVSNAFSASGNYFTTAQAEMLIAQVNNQPNRVSLLNSVYLRVTDPENFTKLYTNLLTSQTHRNQVEAHVNSYGYGSAVSNTSTPSHNYGKYAMSESSFNSIYKTAQNQWSTSAKVNYLVSIMADANNYFTSNQVRQLIQLVPDESNRLILAKTAYRGIVDAQNFSQVTNLLTTRANRNELTAYVNSYNSLSTTTPKSPMAAEAFEKIYLDVQNKWGLGAKMSSLVNIFNNTSYNFSSAQAKQLIELVSSESNRLQLAKSSYKLITDPGNFSQVYEVLSTTQSKNDLSNYVNSYSTTGSTSPAQTMVAMTDAAYNSLYRSVSNTWGFGAKMNSLTEIFSNPSYYFTTDQARKLIELVSAESNRLTLAKLAKERIVDPQNYTQLTAVLSSQSSKEELEAYARQ